MRSILYIVAVVLLVVWIVGAFFETVGDVIHLALLLAIGAAVLGYFRRDKNAAT